MDQVIGTQPSRMRGTSRLWVAGLVAVILSNVIIFGMMRRKGDLPIPVSTTWASIADSRSTH